MVLSTNGAFNVIGALGEVILATAMIPQICLAHKLNSTEYISYAWQVSQRDVIRRLRQEPLCNCNTSRCSKPSATASRATPSP